MYLPSGPVTLPVVFSVYVWSAVLSKVNTPPPPPPHPHKRGVCTEPIKQGHHQPVHTKIFMIYGILITTVMAKGCTPLSKIYISLDLILAYMTALEYVSTNMGFEVYCMVIAG